MMVMNDNEREDNDSAIVESEMIEAETPEPEEIHPTVKRKGSFLSFMAFVFSLAALGLSGYMYYTQHYLAESQNTEKPWQQPLTQLQSQIKNNTDKVEGLKAKISAMKTVNQSISDQLTSVKNTNSTENTGTQVYDDSQLKANIVNLQSHLTEQNKQLSAINQQQDQALAQFKQRYEQEKSKQFGIVESTIDPVQKQKTITQDLISAYLLAAHKDLNISSNVKLATKNLSKAVSKLKELSDSKFLSLIEELNNTSSELNATQKVDVFGLNRGIDALQSSVNKLSFATAPESQEKQASSWYDNLVKIKKIDDKEQKLLTQSEQAAIRQTLRLHFDLLRSALISQNMGLWISEIEALSTLIKKNFAETQDILQDAILTQLNELKYNNINPTFPDLSIYLQKFNALLDTQTTGE